ncbi:hypothetical protein DFH08DRAFT_798168 [Mycena albidolilacea]|uniref:Uncharacterized protein n=1 Tax=Mycena albidolilacea TaxID=1033008 RepID=A0AAD7F675_9AGAR|nr:hypothetical protein DFH08DRAFT_798168 [Mycena albidolilacea]
MAGYVLVLFQRLRWHPLQLVEPPPAIFLTCGKGKYKQSEGLVKFLIEHEDNTFYQNTAEAVNILSELGMCYWEAVGGTCIIFSRLVSGDGVEEEVWFHPRIGTELSGGACFTSNMVVGKLGAC